MGKKGEHSRDNASLPCASLELQDLRTVRTDDSRTVPESEKQVLQEMGDVQLWFQVIKNCCSPACTTAYKSFDMKCF